MTWRSGAVTSGRAAGRASLRSLPAAVVLAVATSAACLAAAGAETWRFALLLAGRTVVLAGGPVQASDVLVGVTASAALILGASTALLALPLLANLHGAAAALAGLRPSRSRSSVVARLVVPGWNLYGAGQVLMETGRSLRAAGRRDRGIRRMIALWWLAWLANGLLVLAALILAFGRSNQQMADTVELHIAINLVAALVAALFAAILLSLAGALAGGRGRRYVGWAVQPPASTARNRRNPARTGSTDLDSHP